MVRRGPNLRNTSSRPTFVTPCKATPDEDLPRSATELVTWGGKLPSRRRFIGGISTSLLIALGGNLGGCTSFLLSTFDKTHIAQELGIDALIPINGRKRFKDSRFGFELTYPSEWLQDYTIAERQQRRAEKRRAIDPPSLKAKQQDQSIEEPLVAIGPPGSTGEINLSVIAAPIFPGFTIRGSFGSPEEGALRFLNSIAPEGSGRTATLIRASERSNASASSSSEKLKDVEPVYELEYLVRGPGFYRHNLSVVATQMIPNIEERLLQPYLYTFNAQCPQDEWEKLQPLLTEASSSFKLLQISKPIL